MTANRLASVVCASLLLTACSIVPNNATVTVNGTLQNGDGSPASSIKVLLFRIPDPLELLTEGIAFVESLGTICLAPNPPALCKTFEYSTTDASGDYGYTLSGSDVKGSVGEISTFTLSASDGSSAYLSSTFQINQTTVVIPALRFWHPATLTVTPSASSIGYQWSALAGATTTAVDFTAADGALVWSASAQSGGSSDARVAEDVSGTFAVESTTATVHSDGISFSDLFRSPPIAFAGQAGAPLSRGVGCFVADGSGDAASASPCTLTNGTFGDAFAPTSCTSTSGSCAANTFVGVDLGQSMTIHAVLLHNLSASGSMVIETSPDESTWTLAGSTTAQRFTSVTLAAPQSARYVRARMTVTSGSAAPAISSLGEFSVY